MDSEQSGRSSVSSASAAFLGKIIALIGREALKNVIWYYSENFREFILSRSSRLRNQHAIQCVNNTAEVLLNTEITTPKTNLENSDYDGEETPVAG